MTAAAEPVIELRGITKRFPGVTANDRVDLAVQAGEIHAVVGENGAGKSTLMRVLYGLYQPDAGGIRVRGAPARIESPADALRQAVPVKLDRPLGQHPVLPEDLLRLGRAAPAPGQVGLEGTPLGHPYLAGHEIAQGRAGLLAGQNLHEAFSTVSRRRTHSRRSCRTRWSICRTAAGVIESLGARSVRRTPSK
jgi:ABC-type hemin transport system ATPase subunit